MALIKPLVFIHSFDPKEIRQHLAEGAGGVVLREHPRGALTHIFNWITPQMRKDFAQGCYIEEENGTRRVHPQSRAPAKSGWGKLPEGLQNALSQDMKRLGQIQDGYGHLAMIFKQNTNPRWHIDGMEPEIPDAVYLHHHIGGGAGLCMLNPRTPLEIKENFCLKDDAVNLDSQQIDALLKDGQARMARLAPGDSVFFGPHMAQAAGLTREMPLDRYLIMPLKNPQAVPSASSPALATLQS